ncbi:hypothetical protein [Pararhodonellum marinum]|uniref:hypothetical protein n=1 Tax=Pararhodonellum marinum TaxID=2755358 RepID=UPI00188F5C96|nr:hypothetical protein [Pararhodonellum marinum]
MRKLLPVLFAMIIFVALGSCTSTSSIPTAEGSFEGIEVFTAKIPDKNFEEIKFIQVQGGWFSGPRGLMNTLVKRAKSEGADGLVNVQYNTLHIGSTISGTAVKFETSSP